VPLGILEIGLGTTLILTLGVADQRARRVNAEDIASAAEAMEALRVQAEQREAEERTRHGERALAAERERCPNKPLVALRAEMALPPASSEPDEAGRAAAGQAP
jgi:hypothetical protein